jgi:flagellum-specific ATP synthase
MNAHPFVLAIKQLSPAQRVGHVRAVASAHLEAEGPFVSVGDMCEIEAANGSILAEVAAVGEQRIVLVPLDQNSRLSPCARVVARAERARAGVGDAFSGRAINALGEAMDGGDDILPNGFLPLQGEVLAPIERAAATRVVETGIRAIDGLLTLGEGQRVGLFAAAGVGKTTLLSELARNVAADRCVVCLVGERGREVESLWRSLSSRPDAKRYTCVAATSDQSAPMRVRAAFQAIALAEYWRARGEHVLLVFDSITRFAMAQREIGLAAGAPPTLRAYTPNVFAALPRLVERCGARVAGGAITAIMTVLAETDDVDDPIAEVMKSLLDGHIILSRALADQGHYPAIDILRSVSRLAHEIITPEHAAAAGRASAQLAVYDDARVMIESGLHRTGANPRLDRAIATREPLMAFLRQEGAARVPLSETVAALSRASNSERRHA